MTIKNEKQIQTMHEGGKILAIIIRNLKEFSQVGVTSQEIDLKAQKLMRKYRVISAFKNFNSYPAHICISINDEVVHGLPTKRKIKTSDIVSIDAGIIYKSYCTDSAITFGVRKITKNAQKLIKVTSNSLSRAIDLIKPGVHLGTIQAKIQKEIENGGLGLVKSLTGHGIGKNLQEEPQIPNHGQVNTGLILKPGMTFCLEPMVTLGSGKIKLKSDGWTIVSEDHTLAAHFEHTIAVTQTGYKILTK